MWSIKKTFELVDKTLSKVKGSLDYRFAALLQVEELLVLKAKKGRPLMKSRDFG